MTLTNQPPQDETRRERERMAELWPYGRMARQALEWAERGYMEGLTEGRIVHYILERLP